jgi:hypothetical protein
MTNVAPVTCQTGQFTKTTVEFIRSLIIQRKRLITDNKSLINKASALKIIDEITLLLNTYAYNDLTISKFIVRHYDAILYLIPGFGSSCSNTQMSKFSCIYHQATIILTRHN